jgi:hypothetical protein
LEARVIIASYNQHIGSFPEPSWLVCTTKVYSGVGADIVMESIALRTSPAGARMNDSRRWRDNDK